MRIKSFELFTIVTTALSAAAFFIASYEMGVFPGGFFGNAALGPLPLWSVCLTLVFLLIAVCVGTVLRIVREQKHG